MTVDRAGLPVWFYRYSPLTMDALKGPDEQYLAGARDMLAVIDALATEQKPKPTTFDDLPDAPIWRPDKPKTIAEMLRWWSPLAHRKGQVHRP